MSEKCLLYTPQDLARSPPLKLEIDSIESQDQCRWMYSAYFAVPSDRNSYEMEKCSIQWIEMRERIYLHRGHNPEIVVEFLEYIRHWFELRRALLSCIGKAKSFVLDYGIRHNSWSEVITKKINQLEGSSKDIIQLELNRISINEVCKSTALSKSMNLLSGVTGLFGMNVDVLESNPPWWLFLIFAAATLVMTCSLRPSLERRFAWLLGPPEDPKYASTAPYGFR
ncbi:hypothetical protein F4810DRAFT_709829 [Camillea tinctor]|nr:hypothetical protein F4810DRAFT_709829 [Camillea tinctor]